MAPGPASCLSSNLLPLQVQEPQRPAQTLQPVTAGQLGTCGLARAAQDTGRAGGGVWWAL